MFALLATIQQVSKHATRTPTVDYNTYCAAQKKRANSVLYKRTWRPSQPRTTGQPAGCLFLFVICQVCKKASGGNTCNPGPWASFSRAFNHCTFARLTLSVATSLGAPQPKGPAPEKGRAQCGSLAPGSTTAKSSLTPSAPWPPLPTPHMYYPDGGQKSLLQRHTTNRPVRKQGTDSACTHIPTAHHAWSAPKSKTRPQGRCSPPRPSHDTALPEHACNTTHARTTKGNTAP